VRRSTIAVLSAMLALGVGARRVVAQAAGTHEPLFTAEVEALRVGVDDPFQLTVTISGRSIDLKGEISAPELGNLRVLGGPSLSTQMSIINGAITQTRSYTWVLQALAPGEATVGPVRATLGEQERATSSITLEVVAGNVIERRAPARRRGFPFEDEDPLERFFGRRQAPTRPVKVSVEAVPGRTEVWVGEPLLLTYDLLTQARIEGLQFADAPAYPGFWSEDLEQTQQPQTGERVTRDGEVYQRFVVARKLLFPTKAGTLTIPAASFRVGVAQLDPFFGSLPGGGAVVERRTAAVTISVRALPVEVGALAAVGRFKVSAVVDRQALALGEAANVLFKIEGNGNLKWIERAPELVVPGAKVYPPEVKTKVKTGADGMSGSKAWEFVIVPETAGTLTIPGVPFDHFDPRAGKVVHARTDPISLSVETATASAGAGVVATTKVVGAPTAGTQLRLRSEGVGRHARVWATPRLVGLVAALVFASHLLLLALPRLSVHLRGGRTARGTSGAGVRGALAELRRVTHSSKLGKESAATVIEKALTDVFGDINERASADENERDHELREILADVRFVRYAPQLGDYSEKITDVAERARAAIRRWA
jgi:hypothetical protein